MFDSKLGQFLQSVDPGLRACSDGKGRYWAEDAEGKEVDAKNLPFTPEEVAAWQAPAIVDKAADVEAAMAAAKLGTAAVKATAAVEAIEKLNARVAELEKRLGL
jgi:acyl-CoA reductase-like NAD-dependent aldehyde dehydrogenase